jgi:O-6-methylguanine DNA methyltransferase
LRAILSGQQPVNLPPLDIRAGTEFQRSVWLALREIPSGKTRSYGEVAAAICSPKATRAVGSACGANPIPLLIPCHRVLANGGKLGGFSGGLEWKKRLLAIERVMVETATPTLPWFSDC